jgi:hypothetical protein
VGEHRPFYCGTQGADWRESNCGNCHRSADCEILTALDDAYCGTGEVSEEIARRMGYLLADGSTKLLRYGWRCTELEEVEPISTYAKRLAPPPTKLCPLWKRVRRTLSAAWTFWIPPWDRADHDCYSSLRSPVLAWQVAWDIHHDDTARQGAK